MYRGVSYILNTYDLRHNFVRSPTVEKFNPPANFSQFKHCFAVYLCWLRKFKTELDET